MTSLNQHLMQQMAPRLTWPSDDQHIWFLIDLYTLIPPAESIAIAKQCQSRLKVKLTCMLILTLTQAVSLCEDSVLDVQAKQVWTNAMQEGQCRVIVTTQTASAPSSSRFFLCLLFFSPESPTSASATASSPASLLCLWCLCLCLRSCNTTYITLLHMRNPGAMFLL